MEIKAAIEELRGLSDKTVHRLWMDYQRQTMDYRGNVVRENDWARFRDWLFSNPFVYHSACESSLLVAMRWKLNVSEIIVLGQGEIPTFDPPADGDPQCLISTATPGIYLLMKRRERLYPSIVDIMLTDDPAEMAALEKKDGWDGESVSLALNLIRENVLSPLRHSHESRCDISDIRLYVRLTEPRTGCLYIGVVAQCIETGSRMWWSE